MVVTSLTSSHQEGHLITFISRYVHPSTAFSKSPLSLFIFVFKTNILAALIANVSSLPSSVLPACSALSFLVTHLSLLADVLCNYTKLMRALVGQSEPSSLLSAAICRQDYLLVHSAVYRQDHLGLAGLYRRFGCSPLPLESCSSIVMSPWPHPLLNKLKKRAHISVYMKFLMSDTD